MSKRLQLRKGTTAQQATFTGAVGEPTYDTEKKTVVVHDGVKAGGIVLAKELDNLAVTKADFFAQAEKRIRDGAGSGFAEWGKHYQNGNQYQNVNQGLWSYIGTANTLAIGASSVFSADATSRTVHPVFRVNGVQSTLRGVLASGVNNQITLPPAPDGTKTYDSATGSVVEHASAAEAFEGLVTNGNLRNGTTGWNPASFSGLSVVNGMLRVTNEDATPAWVSQEIPTVIGVEYVLSVSHVEGTLTNARMYVGNTIGTAGVVAPVGLIDGGVTSITFVAVSTSSFLTLDNTTSTINGYHDYGSVSLMPVTESVITSRQDFTFLESFHEKISDKDVVYPLGNVQYGANTWEGITLSNTVEAQGYSAFGEWDTATKGYGVVWSTLSDANKAKFLQDPENNIYNDDGELIQVRYRIRVFEGVEESLINISPHTATESANLMSNSAGYHVQAQGSGIVATTWRGSGNAALTFRQGEDVGVGSTFLVGGVAANISYIPIALVQRRNQGAYHPAFNSNGTASGWQNDGGGRAPWYSSDIDQFISTSTCFVVSTDATGASGGYDATTGLIGGRTDRPDSKFYDAIYASDVQDLRMSSKLLPRKEIREKYKPMGNAGEVRGFEGVPFTKVNSSSGNLVNTGESSPAGSMGNCWYLRTDGVGDSPFSKTTPNTFFDLDTSSRKHYIVADDGTIQHVESAYTSSGFVFVVRKSTYSENPFQGWVGKTGIRLIYIDHISSHQQASPTWTDIIGSPANIAATFPQGVEGQWIPNLHTQSNFYPLSRKALGSSLVKESTDDSGVTWSAGTRTANTTFNRVELALVDPRVELWHYTTQAHFTADDVNSKVLDLGGVSAINSSDTRVGTILESSLINKIGTSSTSVDKGHEYSLIKSAIWYPTGALEKSSILPEHAVIDLSTVSPAVKTLDYLSSENGVAKLMYAYKEMVYDSGADTVDDFTNVNVTFTAWVAGTSYHLTDSNRAGVWECMVNNTFTIDSDELVELEGTLVYKTAGTVYFKRWDGNGFGDNNQFEITNNQATQTDDNGNTVLYGTASFNTQYFIVEE